MFGYGSLISPDSPPHGLTPDQAKKLIPYSLTRTAGYRRVWTFRHGTAGITALGLEKVKDEGDAMDVCGCVYPIDYEKAASLFCGREDGYDLLLVHEENFRAMHPDYCLPAGVGYIWICGAPTSTCHQPSQDACNDRLCKRHYATDDFPILQTYVDSIMVGALRYSTAGEGSTDGMNFASVLIDSIDGWDRPWFNDRLVPGRPWGYRPEWSIIDGLLSTCPRTAKAFANRLQRSLTQTSVWKCIQQTEARKFAPWSDVFFGGCSPYDDDSGPINDGPVEQLEVLKPLEPLKQDAQGKADLTDKDAEANDTDVS